MSRCLHVGPILLLSLFFSAIANAGPFSGLSLVYEANFDDGTLNPSVDALGVGSMQVTDTLISGTSPSAVLQSGGVTFGITRPSGAPAGPVDVGVVATPVSFDLGTVVGIRAVFADLSGPHAAGTQWAVGVVLRDGPVGDLPAASRAVATFQVAGNVAKLNTPFATTPAGLPNVPQGVYDAIFAPAGVEPANLSLELLLDRTTGLAYASLTSGDYFISRSNFTYPSFGADYGSAITAVEPTLAIGSGVDATASARVLDFQVFTRVPEASTGAILGSGLAMLAVGRVSSRRRITKKVT